MFRRISSSKLCSLLLSFVMLLQSTSAAFAAQDREKPELNLLSIPSEIDVSSERQSAGFDFQVSDNDSGVRRIVLKLKHSQHKQLRSKRILRGRSSQPESEDGLSQSHHIDLDFPRNLESGDWDLSVTVIDRAGNRQNYKKADLQALGLPASLRVISNRDTLPPLLTDAAFPASLSLANGDTELNLLVKAKDASGIKKVDAIFRRTRARTELISSEAPINLTGDESEFALAIPFIQDMPRGDWSLSLVLTDLNDRRIRYRSRRIRKLGINNILNLNDEPIQEPDEGTNVEPEDLDPDQEANQDEEDSEEESPAPNSGGGSSGGGGSTPPAPPPVDPDAPDSMVVAPALSGTEGSLVDNLDFLFTGSNPMQTGVAQGTIDQKRVAVLRGKVFDVNMNPISGVTVTVHSHNEFGQTQTMSNGEYNFALNGGNTTTLRFNAAGYLPVQRQVEVPVRDFFVLEDIVLTQLDTAMTTVSLNNSSPEVAQSSVCNDADGQRQTSIMFPAGTTAEMVMPDGTMQPLSSINVRATEYTVGPTGLRAMPGSLPPTSAYTFAVELSVDEAMAAGSEEVKFNQAVPIYVDNYLNFPIGENVPVGYYDRQKAVWIPSEDGRIIQILRIESGKAVLDVDGNGLDASNQALADLGINDAELIKLAEMYSAGKSLWRVAVTHFTPWDCNWPAGPPEDSLPPPDEPPENPDDNQPDNPCQQSGSIVECQNQTIGESVDLVGTPFTLEYRSDRVKGRKASRALEIPLSGANVPQSLKKIELEIQIAGRKIKREFDPLPNQSFNFEWDGLDTYGREVAGTVKANIIVAFLYNIVYYDSRDDFENSFALPTGSQVGAPTRIIGQRGSQEIRLTKSYIRTVTQVLQDETLGLGAWSLSPQHFYDSTAEILYKGDGTIRSTQSIASVLETVKGGNLDHQPTPRTILDPALDDLAINSNGLIYFLDQFDQRGVFILQDDGQMFRVAGGAIGTNHADGVGVFDMSFFGYDKMRIGPDDNVYLLQDRFGANVRIRKLSNGIVTTVAGNGIKGFSGDGGPAINAQIDPRDFAIGKDGSIYIADGINRRIRKVSPDGIITTIAGTGSSRFITGDGSNALFAGFFSPQVIEVDDEGNVYFAESINNRVHKLTPEGLLFNVANRAGTRGYFGDGGLARDAGLLSVSDIEIDSEGNVYIVDRSARVVRKIDTTGIITTIAGTGELSFNGDGLNPIATNLNAPRAIEFNKDGNLLIGEFTRIRELKRGLPSFDGGDLVIPASDGRTYYQFDKDGKHIKTFNALTNAVVYEFLYDASGYLISIIDGDGNVTQVERNGKDVTAIVAPDGQRTEFNLDSNGYLASISNPAGETHSMTYTADGLMTSFTDPKGNRSNIAYDSQGRLISDANAASGSWTLSRANIPDGYEVTMNSAEGRTFNHKVETLKKGGLKLTNSFPDGRVNEHIDRASGIDTVTKADGTVITREEAGDPRFSSLSPIIKSLTVRTPSGLTSQTNSSRTVSLTNSNDPLSLNLLTETSTINGRTFTSTYNAVTNTFNESSATNRTSARVIDSQGRTLSNSVAGLANINFTYDSRGRLQSVSRGSGTDERITNFTYGSDGFLSQIQDAAGDLIDLDHDAVGRVIQEKLNQANQVDFSFDANNNATGVKPPAKENHAFNFTPVNLVERYSPPNLSGIPDVSTRYSYSPDKDLRQITRPDGSTVDFSYDTSTGQLTQVSVARGNYDYSYKTASAQLQEISAPGSEILKLSYDGFLPTGEDWDGTIDADVDLTYNNNFFVSSRDVNDANQINFTYDADGVLTQAGSMNINISNQNTLILGTSLNNLNTDIAYNQFGEPIDYSAKYSGSEIYKNQYTRDKLGRVLRNDETIQGVTNSFEYTYDNDKRLSEVKKNGLTIRTYNYDENGNRLTLNQNGGTLLAAQYDAQDRLIQYGDNQYQYTANGDLLSKTNTSNNQTISYNYDEFGNLITANLPNKNIEYVIDGRNRRIGKKVDGNLVQGFVYKDQLEPIAELDAAGNVVSRFIYGVKSHVPDYMVKNGVSYRIISDNVGSVRLVVDTLTGNVAQRIDYDEFGNITLDTNPGFQPFAFAGGLYDQDTKLVRFGARDYDPEIGRWTAKDPILFRGGQSNLYVYVNNDPINFIDPSGLFNTQGAVRSGAQGAVMGAFSPVPPLGSALGAAAGIICGGARNPSNNVAANAALDFATGLPAGIGSGASNALSNPLANALEGRGGFTRAGADIVANGLAGAAIGGIIAGPPGAGLGAAIGVVIGGTGALVDFGFGLL